MERTAQANFKLPVSLTKEVRRRARREKRFPAHLIADALRLYLSNDGGAAQQLKTTQSA